MIDLSKLQALLHPVSDPAANVDAVAVADGYALVDLERYRDTPARFRGSFATRWPDDWLAYLDQHAGAHSAVFIDDDRPRARAILDYRAEGGASAVDLPAWGQHSALLELQKTPPYSALCNQADGQRRHCDALIDLLLDWPDDLRPCRAKGDLDWEHQDLAQALHELRHIKTQREASAEHEIGDFAQGRSLTERQAIRNQPPGAVQLVTPAYDGLPSIVLTGRLRYHLDSDKPLYSLRLEAAQAIRRSLLDVFTESLIARLDNEAATKAVSVFRGRWTNDNIVAR